MTDREKRNSRLVAWALVLALVPVAAATAAMHTAYRRASSELIIERDQQLTYLSAARLEDQFLSFSEALSTLARTPEIYRRNVADQQAALERAARRLAAFDAGVVLLDSFGMVRATLPQRPEILLQDWSDRRFFQELLTSSDVAFSDGVSDGPNGATVTIIGVRILNEKGEFVGSLAGMFGLGKSTISSFYASIVRLRMGQSGTTYVVDGTGRILYDSDYAGVGAAFDPSGLPPGVLQGLGGAVRTRGADGRQIIAAYAPVPRTGWTLITKNDWATVTRDTRRYGSILLGLLAAGVFLPACGVALFLRQRHAKTHELEQLEQARHVAGLVKKALLPKHVPILPGWNLAVHYQPTSTICGDFYDYLLLTDGRLMLTVGDIADNSVQAALVTATTRAALRGAAHHSLAPTAALAQGNELLCPEVEPGKSVSAIYSVLDPATGRFEFASAGKALSYHGGNGLIHELNTSGQALGLKLGAEYEQSEVTIRPGEWMLFVTDGLVSARNSQGEPFGASRLKAVLEREGSSGQALVEATLSALRGFVGTGRQPEDDVTVVLLEHSEGDVQHD